MVTATSAVIKEQRSTTRRWRPRGIPLFARFNYVLTLPDGSTTTVRALAYYHLADGRIVVNGLFALNWGVTLGSTGRPGPTTSARDLPAVLSRAT